MNVDIVGRIRPPIRGEGSGNLEIDGQRLADKVGGTYFSFQQLFRQDSSTHDVYRAAVEPLLDLCVAGFNTCLLVVGESDTGKSYTLAGGPTNQAGMVPLVLENIFTKIGEVRSQGFEGRGSMLNQVSLQVYEVYNEMLHDLLAVPGVRSHTLAIEETSKDGVKVMGGTVVPVGNATDAVSLFQQAWARRNVTVTDYGPAKNFSSVIVNIDVSLKSGQNPFPNKSRFSLVLTPGAEKLAEDSAQIRLREGPTLSKAIISLSQLVAALASQPYADRVINYNDSKLTQLLREELGGNCKTRVLVCVKPETDSRLMGPLLRFASQLTKVTNFPVLNDAFSQQLLTLYRARIVNLQQQLGLGLGYTHVGEVHDTQEELRRVQTENLELRDRNERLHSKLDTLQGKFGTLASTKTDLSSQLLMTEEEKLKVSKMLVEMQIENNKIREESEAAKFELTNKIIQLEHDLTEAELQRDKFSRAAKSAKEKLDQVEKERRDLADEYIVLKTNFLSLNNKHEKEVARNEELSMELLNLINTNATLLRQMETMDMLAAVPAQTAELDRLRSLVDKNRQTGTSKDFIDFEKERQTIEKNLFGSQKRFDSELDTVKTHYDADQKKLQLKLANLTRDLNEARNLARERQKKVAELNAALINLRGAHDQLQTQFNHAQHKLKDVNDEFRSRLVKYIKDVAGYVDADGVRPSQDTSTKMRDYVEAMIKDLRKAHHVREEQLSLAAQGYKQRLEAVLRKHEELLVAYRELRQQVEAQGLDDLDLGPDEQTLQMSDTQLQSSQQREINRLRDDLNQALTDLEAAQLRLRVDNLATTEDKNKINKYKRDRRKDEMSNLRKQLREFTNNTQQELEDERARLLTSNAVLEEELAQYKHYVDTHLVRYKEEITRLRRQLGIDEPQSQFSSPGPKGAASPASSHGPRLTASSRWM